MEAYQKKLKVLALFLILFWSTLIYLVVFSNIANNPELSVSKVYGLDIRILVPQGWAFFTRNPRNLSYQLYKKNDNKYVKVFIQNFHSTNNFGLSRRNRAMQAQVMTLLKNERINWDDSADNQFNLVPKSTENSKIILNSFSTPLICGKYILEAYYPIPLSYSKFTTKRKSKKVYLEIVCDETL